MSLGRIRVESLSALHHAPDEASKLLSIPAGIADRDNPHGTIGPGLAEEAGGALSDLLGSRQANPAQFLLAGGCQGFLQHPVGCPQHHILMPDLLLGLFGRSDVQVYANEADCAPLI